MKTCELKTRPDACGLWMYRPSVGVDWKYVEVTETQASGRLCQQLKMGGSLQCPGFTDWRGDWVNPRNP